MSDNEPLREPLTDAQRALNIECAREALGRYRSSRKHEPSSYAALHLALHGHDLRFGCCSGLDDQELALELATA